MKEEIHTLYIFGGLPGTGKSTLASALASELRAPYLRVDVVEAWRNVAESLGIPFVEIKSGLFGRMYTQASNYDSYNGYSRLYPAHLE
ncbi:AAA family ATPase [Paenibacillus rhizoplanae]|uniref:AAA family ATPase n=1 Tax=Paenibacillus rhizoplanae TaxID=1917181 RepID=A0ABW5FIB7_9BACL